MERRTVLEELYSPREPSNLDIVFVHGIDGDPVKTWTAKSGSFWPQTLLPTEFPRARVWSFGYNADMYRNNSVAGIRENARTLLSFFGQERKKLRLPTPIIFIAHCLGGLIVKQALSFAEYDSSYKNAAIHIHTVLTVFFGTPNQGTHRDNWKHIAKLYAGLGNGGRPTGIFASLFAGKRSALVDVLLRESDELSEVNEVFCNLTDHYSIANFYETATWGSTGKLIVGMTDAQIGVAHESLHPVDQNHVEMCHFKEGKNDGNFGILCSEIEEAADISRASAAVLADEDIATPRDGEETTSSILRPDRMTPHTGVFPYIPTKGYAHAVGEDRTVGDRWVMEEEMTVRATRRYRPATAATASLSVGNVANYSTGPQRFVESASSEGNTYSSPRLMLEGGAEQDKAGEFEGLFGDRKTRDHALYMFSSR